MDAPDLREQVQAIQTGLRRAGREMVLSSAQSFLHGTVVLLGCGASLPLIGRPWWEMTALWGGILLVTLAADLALYLRLAAKHPDKFLTGIERQLLKFLALLVAIGLVTNAALLAHGRPEMAPALWMLVVGAGYAAVGFFSFTRTWILGVLACAGGAAALFLEPFHAFLILGLVLGIGSLAWGLVQRRREAAGRETD